MKKIILLTIIMVLLLTIPVLAELTQCEEPIDPLEECLMITPVISCEGDYDYAIINATNTTIETGNLTEYEAGTYSFNWSQDTGEYVIVLCDGATREIIIGGKTKMLSTTIGIIAFVFLLFFAASRINNESSIYLKGLKVLFFINALIFMLFIPLSNMLTDFETRFWIYIMWMLRVYAAYALIVLIAWAFKKFDIKRRFRL